MGPSYRLAHALAMRRREVSELPPLVGPSLLEAPNSWQAISLVAGAVG